MPKKGSKKRKSDTDIISELKVKLKKLEENMSRQRSRPRRRRRIRVFSSSSESSPRPSSPECRRSRPATARPPGGARSQIRSRSPLPRLRSHSRSPRRRRRDRSRTRSPQPLGPRASVLPAAKDIIPADRRPVRQLNSDSEDAVSTHQQVLVAQAQVHAPPPTEPRAVSASALTRTPLTSSPSAIVSRPQVRRVAAPASEPDILPDEVIESTHPANDKPADLPCADCPAELELNENVLEILGDDPTKTKVFGKDIQKDLAVRFQHIATNGLSKELRKELREKHPVPANCVLINAPQVNPEVKAAISETASKRLGGMEQKQKQLANAISCLGEAISLLIMQKDTDPDLLKLLMDASRIICDTQYSDSLTRRFFILASLKKDMKDQLLQTKIDTFLFGSNLAETLKSAKAINKSGAELKQNYASSKPQTWKSNNKNNIKKNNLNTKTAPSSHTRPRALAPKNQPVSSYRSSRPTSKHPRSHR